MSRLAAVLVLMAVLGAAAAPAPAFAFANPTPVASPSAAATAAPSDSFAGDARALLGGSLAEAVAAQAQLGSALAENAAQRESVRRELGATDARIAELDASIAARDVQIDDVRRRADWERAQVTALARAIDGQPLSIIQRLVQTRGLAELVAGVADLTSAGRRGDALADALDRDREQLEREQEEQREERANQADMRARQQADLEQLQRLMAEEGRVAASLAASVRRTRSELARSRPGDAALADRVLRALLADQASLVAAAQQVAWDQAALWMDANPALLAAMGPARPPAFAWPVPEATITQGFGPTDLAIEPPLGGYAHFHTGVDLAAEPGTPVLAADDGMVAGAAAGTTAYGTYVVLAHPSGLTTLYGHLQQALVRVGERVARGEPVGLLGSTGNSTGPHCHFEVRSGDRPVDPLPLLRS